MQRFLRPQTIYWAFVIAAFLSSVARGDEELQHPLIGCWQAISVADKGHTEPLEFFVRFFADRLETESPDGKVSESLYFANDKTDPKQLDFTIDFGGGAAFTWKGIYAIEGDTLRWCVAAAKRPTDFKTAEGDGRRLTILRRSSNDPCRKEMAEEK